MFFLFRRRRRSSLARRKLAAGDSIRHLGGSYALRVISDTAKPQGCALCDNFLNVNLHDADLTKAAWQEEVRMELLLWHKKQARQIFKERTDYWREVLGVTYRRLLTSNARRLWGSCNAKDDIRLNWRLIMAPPELLDYVIVHELCHVTHKNHSRRFWNMVASVMPDWKQRRFLLRALDPTADV